MTSLSWGLAIFEERIAAQGMTLTEEGREEFARIHDGSAQTAAAKPKLFDRYWQMVHRVMREQGDLAASAAFWSKTEAVGAQHVHSAFTAHREIKNWTWLCTYSPSLLEKAERTEAA